MGILQGGGIVRLAKPIGARYIVNVGVFALPTTTYPRRASAVRFSTYRFIKGGIFPHWPRFGRGEKLLKKFGIGLAISPPRCFS